MDCHPEARAFRAEGSLHSFAQFECVGIFSLLGGNFDSEEEYVGTAASAVRRAQLD
jgi:hypothetical protein